MIFFDLTRVKEHSSLNAKLLLMSVLAMLYNFMDSMAFNCIRLCIDALITNNYQQLSAIPRAMNRRIEHSTLDVFLGRRIHEFQEEQWVEEGKEKLC